MTQTLENDDPLEDEIQSWQDFSSVLKNGGEEIFQKMLNECREYKDAINTKGSLYSTESTLMTITFIQQKLIKELLSNCKNK